MNKIIGNYTTQSNNDFPLDCETLQYIQENHQMAELIGNIAGDKVILYGCSATNNGVNHSSGYVFVRTKDYPTGEVLYFAGGSGDSFYLSTEAIEVTADAYKYKSAYTKRILRSGVGAEQWEWADFIDMSKGNNRKLSEEISALKSKINSLQPAPIGAIMIWSSSKTPDNYMLCDGSSLNRTDYSDLFSVIGTTFGSNDDSSFKIPDMRGLFVVGKGLNDYNNIGDKGGSNTVTLELENIPKHNHDSTNSTEDGNVETTSNGQHSHSYTTIDKDGWGSKARGGSEDDSTTTPSTSSAGSHKHTVKLYASGGSNGVTIAHENRPPYIVMSYIIKVK